MHMQHEKAMETKKSVQAHVRTDRPRIVKIRQADIRGDSHQVNSSHDDIITSSNLSKHAYKSKPNRCTSLTAKDNPGNPEKHYWWNITFVPHTTTSVSTVLALVQCYTRGVHRFCSAVVGDLPATLRVSCVVGYGSVLFGLFESYGWTQQSLESWERWQLINSIIQGQPIARGPNIGTDLPGSSTQSGMGSAQPGAAMSAQCCCRRRHKRFCGLQCCRAFPQWWACLPWSGKGGCSLIVRLLLELRSSQQAP